MSLDLYSPLLVFALINQALAVVSLLIGCYKPALLPDWLPRLAATLVLLGVVLALASHLLFGHRPGTTAALAVTDFVAVHPAPFVIGALGLVTLFLALRHDAA